MARPGIREDGRYRLSDVFLRINNRKKLIKAEDFRAAGYPELLYSAAGVWRGMHEWCARTFPTDRGNNLAYVWFGNRLFFLNEEFRAKFHKYWGGEIVGYKQKPMPAPYYNSGILQTGWIAIASIISDRAKFTLASVYDMNAGRDMIKLEIIDPQRGLIVFTVDEEGFPTDELVAQIALLWG